MPIHDFNFWWPIHLYTVVPWDFTRPFMVSPTILPHIMGFERERERHLPATGLLPWCPQQQHLGYAEARNLESHPGLPHEWQGINHSGASSAPSQAHKEESWIWSGVSGLGDSKQRSSIRYAHITSGGFNSLCHTTDFFNASVSKAAYGTDHV